MARASRDTSHWDETWTSRAPEEVSWFQRDPEVSRRLIEEVSEPGASVVDVGGGASTLVDVLLDDGYRDVTVVDIAEAALAVARERLGDDAARVNWVVGDVLELDFGRRYDVWHDRALLHFLVDDRDRHRYLEALHRSTTPKAHVVLATFGPDGPPQCSGLPVRRYDVDAMGEVLGERFELLERVEEHHHTPTGATQQFVYGLFRRTEG